jgi:Plasma-membrane choline transporter
VLQTNILASSSTGVQQCCCVLALGALAAEQIGVATNYSQKYITGADGVRYAAATCTTYSTVGPDPSFNPACSGESQLCFKCICGSTVALPDSECLHYSVNASVYGAMLLSLLWGCAVTAAAAHCTAAGAVAGWWFSGATSSGGYSGNGQVANGHVGGSLKRAATTSLGSLCLAALLTAVARWLRLAVNGLKRQRRGMGSLGIALVECCVHLAERLLRVFNRYF